MFFKFTSFIFFKRVINRLKILYRDKSNIFLSRYRLNKLRKLGIDTNFSIISNNCWGGLVYQHYGLPYLTPTAGLFFFADDYIKFIYNIKEYLNADLEFIVLEESKYYNTLVEYGGECLKCPIAKCKDIEIIFMHYHTPKEAEEKWKRRVSRINWNNVIYKFSEMNKCTLEHLSAFDAFPSEKKVVFTHKDYGLKSQVIYKEFGHIGYVPNDTDSFRRYIDLNLLISGQFNKQNT